MPNRILRPWFDSARVNAVSLGAECLFVRLIQLADDYGLMHAKPSLVAAFAFPEGKAGKPVTAKQVAEWLNELDSAQLIRRTNDNSKPVLQVLRFGQRLREKTKPRFPCPPKWLQEAREWSRARNEEEAAAGTAGHCPALPGTAGHCRPEAKAEAEAEAETETNTGGGGGGGDATPSTVPPNPPSPPGSFRTRKNKLPPLNADYSATRLPELTAKDDVHAITDPIVLAMAITGDTQPQSWKGWVKMLSNARKYLKKTADDTWREVCCAFWHEIKAGEVPDNPGAALTRRLSDALRPPG